MDLVTAFLEAAVRGSLPLALCALGASLSERSGFVNVGLEGAMISGALAAAVAAVRLGTTGAGYGAGVVAGAAVGLVLAALAIGLRANQVLTGAAVSAGCLGLTALLSHAAFGSTGAGLGVPMSAVVPIPVLSDVPVVGRALFSQPPVTYSVFALIPVLWWFLWRTSTGLSLRATGENPEAVRAAGVSPLRIQTGAVIVGSAMAGAGGATLVLAQAGTFSEGITAGRGFIALAVVALGRWHPAGVAAAALLFGASSSLQHLLQALGTPAPYQLFLALPYLLTLVVLAVSGRIGQPAWLGRALP